MALRSRIFTALLSALAAGACSILAPSDDELLGGSGDDAAAKGGKGGIDGGAKGGTGGHAGTPSGGTGGDGGPSGGSGGAPPSGGSAGAPSGGTGGGLVDSGTGASGGSGGGTTCTSSSGPLSPRPVAMYVFVDRSQSMQNKWSTVSDAIASFANSNNANGIQFGLQYFNLENGGTCAGSGYDTPAVPLAALPSNANALKASLATTSANGNTNWEGALNGSKSFGVQYVASNPDVDFRTVFLTDTTGVASECATQWAIFTGILTATWPAFRSYFVGLSGVIWGAVNVLAAAGKTVKALDADGGSGAIVNALEDAATPCRFALPAGAGMGTFSVTLDAGGAVTPIAKVADPSACSADGWFAPNAAPANVVLCPATCHTLVQSASAKIDYQLSCP